MTNCLRERSVEKDESCRERWLGGARVLTLKSPAMMSLEVKEGPMERSRLVRKVKSEREEGGR